METRIQYIFLASIFATLLLIPSTALAFTESSEEDRAKEDGPMLVKEETQAWDEASVIVEPEITRKKIDVATIDAQDVEIGAFVGMMNVEDFGTNSLTGVSIAYHVTEDIFASISLGQTTTGQTSFEVISDARLLTDDERKYQYYDLNVGFNLLPGEGFVGDSTAFNSSFYTIFGVGSTKFAGDQRFTFSGGVGYKVVFQDWFAMHVEAKDHVFDIDILGTDKSTHNINFNVGFTAYF